MTNITLSISDELKHKMDNFSEIRWSEVVRKTIEKKIKDLELLNKLTSKSKLTEKDALEISNKIDRSIAKKLFQ